ncbi:MAG: lumenal Hsp70 protein [Cirrosporium novae-zelandiae]|nr:MAG: lumenal Hsp70 protein [Cirrosporium novae-zelandiae]
MEPPGRRRLTLLNVLLSFLLFTTTASAAWGVIGIDFGTEYLKAVLVKPGVPLEIVLTKDSKRKESAAVAFKPSRSQSQDAKSFPERLYGGDALAVAARFPADVYLNLKPLLGMPVKGSDIVGEYKKIFPGLHLVETEEKGTVGFQSESAGKPQEPFLVEEILAMELKNIKHNADSMAGQGTSLDNVVITIPAFYTAEEKRAILMAADLAGLKVLALISDGLAVGLNYATSRTFPSVSKGESPEYHLVYDMGAGSTTATLIRFQGRTVKDVGKFTKDVQEVQVIGTGWDRTLGGDSLNSLIVEDMVKELAKTDSMTSLGVSAEQIKGHGKTMARLWKESERIRQVLSANSEAYVNLESLYHEDSHFKYMLPRTHFEELTSAQSLKVSTPITQALEAAKLNISDLDSIILHGGAVRTPFVQKQLEALTKDPSKIRTNVNADEAAVFGAAFKAAGLSPSFRVKDIRTSDAAGYAVGLQWKSDSKTRNQKVFTPTSQVGVEKQIPFKNLDDFSFDLYQQLPGADSPTDSPITNIKTKNLTASVSELKDKYGCAATNISTSFVLQLSPSDGLPEVVRGSVSCETTGKKGGVMDEMKGFFGFGSKKADAQEPLQAESHTSSSKTTSSSTSGSPSASTETNSDSSASSPEASEPPKPSTVIIPISFTTSPLGLPTIPSKSLTRIKSRLAAFDASDRARLLREEAFNALESYTYRARELLSDDDFIGASTDSARNIIEEKFEAASDWLYGDGSDASTEILKARLKEIEDLVNPVKKRVEEAKKRPGLIKDLEEKLEQTKMMEGIIKGSIDKAADAAASWSSSSSLSDSSSSATTATTSESDDSDPFASLDEPSTSVSSSTASTIPSPPPSPYTPSELSSVSETYTRISFWLVSKTKEQDSLAAHEDAVLLSVDLEGKIQELNKLVTDLLQRSAKRAKSQEKAKSSKRSTKTKSSSGPGSSSSKKPGRKARSTDVYTSTTTTSAATSSTPHTRDEL